MKVKKILTLVVVSLFAVGLLVVSASAVKLDTTIDNNGEIIDVYGYTLLTDIDTAGIDFGFEPIGEIVVVEFAEIGDCYAVYRDDYRTEVYEVGRIGFLRYSDTYYEFVCWEFDDSTGTIASVNYSIEGYDLYVKHYPFAVEDSRIWGQVWYTTYTIGHGTVDPDNPVVPDNPDNPDTPDLPDVTVPYGSALDWFSDTLDVRSNNFSYGLLQSLYNGYGDSRFFDVPFLVSGITDLRNSPNYVADVSLWLSVIPDGEYASSQMHGVVDVDAFACAFYTDYGLPDYYSYFQSGKIQLSIYFESTGNCRAVVSFYPDAGNSAVITLEYNGTFDSLGLHVKLDAITSYYGTQTTDELTKIDFSFTVSEGTTPNLLSSICELLYVRDICTYDDVVYSPRGFYEVLEYSYKVGYDDGNRYGYQLGYDDGYAKGEIDGYNRGHEVGYAVGHNDGYQVGRTEGYNTGYDVGYDAGYDVGYAEHPDYNNGYDDGYNKAVGEIDSGEFGENLLGATFSAPIRALREFVLVDLPDGNSITLMGVFSAFLALTLLIVFMRKFAGD